MQLAVIFTGEVTDYTGKRLKSGRCNQQEVKKYRTEESAEN